MSMPLAEERGPQTRHGWLVAEYLVLFFVLPGAYAVAAPALVNPIPVLLLVASAAALYLRRRQASGHLARGRTGQPRRQLAPLLVRWALIAAAAFGVLGVLAPDLLFELPGDGVSAWAGLIVVYPLLSAYPQELVFRAFLFDRYRPVFGTGTGVVAASAVAFGFVHVVYGNWVAVALSLAGGWLFAHSYRRTRSLVAVAVEHALYGVLVFVLGLGGFLDHGTTG